MKQMLKIIGIAALCFGSLAASTSTGGTTLDNLNFYKGALIAPLGYSSVNPIFILGANSVGASATDDQKALTIARTEVDGAIGAQTIKVTPLAPTPVTLNGVVSQVNPLNNNPNSNLLLYQGMYPVVLGSDGLTIYMVTDIAAGSTLIGNTIVIGDSSGANTGGVAGLAVSDDQSYFFAAVSGTGKAWSDKDAAAGLRGIAMLSPSLTSQTITPLNTSDLTNVTPGNQAAQVVLTTAVGNYISFKDTTLITPHVANTATAELFSNNVAMHWNANLDRLYIGLNKVKRDDPTKEGGIMGLFMGYVGPNPSDTTKTALILVPFIKDLKRALFYDKSNLDYFYNSDANVMGFYYDGISPLSSSSANNGFDDIEVSVKKIKSMYTSTGYDYLIIHSSVGLAGKNREGVYALPLLGTKDPAGTAITDPTLVGSLSAVNNVTGVGSFSAAPATINDMVGDFFPAVKICQANDSLTDMFVVGDTVFMCMSGGATASMGIWASSAIFDASGFIAGWSAPYRLGGTIDRVMSGAFDPSKYSLYMLTAASNDKTTAGFNTFNKVQVTNWGQTDKVAAANNLSSLLSTLFPVANGGLVGFSVFDTQTPGIKVGSMVMGVALGLNKVALIQLGKRVNGWLIAETNFVQNTTANPTGNVFVFDTTTSPDLAAIAPLTCVEVSRMTANDSGWLFIGGYNGVVVLSNDVIATNDPYADLSTSVAGRGWASTRGLSALQAGNVNAFPYGAQTNTTPPSPATNWTFKQLVFQDAATNPVTLFNVRRMCAVNGKLNVLCLYNMYSFTMTAASFVKGQNITITPFTGTALPDATIYSDMLIANDPTGVPYGVVATNNGLFSANLTANTLTAGNLANMFIRSLQVVGNNNPLPSTLWDIYALVIDRVGDDDMLYNSVSEGKVLDFEVPRWGFMTNGTHVYSFMPKYCKGSADVAAHTIGADATVDLTQYLSVGSNVDAFPYAIVRNTLNGAPYVISDQGFDVNQ